MLIQPRISNQHTLTSSATSENLNFLNRLDFVQLPLKYIGNKLKNKSPNLVIETIAPVNLVIKTLFASLEGRERKDFEGWKIRGKIKKSFKFFKNVVF